MSNKKNIEKSRTILDFIITDRNNVLGVTISSKLTMPIIEQNLKLAFKREEVRECCDKICNNIFKLVDINYNAEMIRKTLTNSKSNSISVMTLNIAQTGGVSEKNGNGVLSYFEINHQNIIKISGEGNAKSLKRYLELDKESLQCGADFIIDAILKSMIDYKKMRLGS